MTNSLTTDCIDQELQLDALATISGGGKQAKTKVGQWLERKFGDGDGTHEGDYANDVSNFVGKVVGTIIFKKAIGVHNPPEKMVLALGLNADSLSPA